MADHVSIPVPAGTERDEVQQPQQPHQQQQGWIDSARKFHVLFGLLKLLIITRSQSLNIICEVIYLLSLIEVTGPASSNWVYWCLYVGSGTLGFELLLWMNLSPVTSLAVNLCLLVYALASSGLLVRGSDQLLRLVQPLDDEPFSESSVQYLKRLSLLL